MYKYVHCRKIYNLSVLALEQVNTRVFWGVFIYRQCMLCLSCNVKKLQTTAKLLWKEQKSLKIPKG